MSNSLTLDPRVTKLGPRYQGVVMSMCATFVNSKTFAALARQWKIGISILGQGPNLHLQYGFNRNSMTFYATVTPATLSGGVDIKLCHVC